MSCTGDKDVRPSSVLCGYYRHCTLGETRHVRQGTISCVYGIWDMHVDCGGYMKGETDRSKRLKPLLTLLQRVCAVREQPCVDVDSREDAAVAEQHLYQ